MLRLSRNGIGVLTSQYRSVLKKCAFLNMLAAGVFAFASNAQAAGTGTNIDSLSSMGTEISDSEAYNQLYVIGTTANNTTEMFSTGDKRSWITNYGSVTIGLNDAGEVVTTTIKNKHSIPDPSSASAMTPAQGGGVISNQNEAGGGTSMSGAHLRVGNTTFENNSVSDFATDADLAVAAGGVVSNISLQSFGINNSILKGNYVLQFSHAEGGAVYNGLADNFGTYAGDAQMQSTQNVYSGNHAGNENLSIIPVSILNAWRTSEYYSTRKDGITDMAAGGAVFNVGIYESSGDRYEYNYARGKNAYGGAIYNTFIDPRGLTGDDSNMLFVGDTTFDGNYAFSAQGDRHGVAYGGAIYNENNIDFLTTAVSVNTLTMQNNYAKAAMFAWGGAIYNGTDEGETRSGTIQTIQNALFKNNYSEVTGENGQSWGGAIYNDGRIVISDATFESNRAISATTARLESHGGAIANYGEIVFDNDDVTNDIVFQSNRSDCIGGAIYNGQSGVITGVIANTLKFTGNTDTQSSSDYGTEEASSSGAIFNDKGTIDLELTGKGKIVFEKYGQDNTLNYGTIKITGDNNTAQVLATRSAMEESNVDDTKTMVELGATFTGSGKYEITNTQLNLVDSGTGSGYIGFVPSMNLEHDVVNIDGTKDSHIFLTSNSDTLVDNDFYISDENGKLYYGDYNPDYNNFSPAYYMENHGTYIYDDQPQKDAYLKSLYSDEANPGDTDIKLANTLVNYGTVTTAYDAFITKKVHIGTLDSRGDNNKIIIDMDNYNLIKVDTEHKLIPEAPAGYEFGTYAGVHYDSEVIVIDSIVSGTTNVIFADPTAEVFTEYPEVTLDKGQRIYFAQTQKTQGLEGFEWKVVNAVNDDYTIKIGYDENGSVYDWFLYRDGETPPPPPPPPPGYVIPPEEMALIDLPRASLEQIRSIMLNIGKTNRSYCNCYQDQCNNTFCRMEQGSPKARLWATPFFRWGTFEEPFETDFKIFGLDFGLDYQPHTTDLVGIFGSYRRGKFDNDGNKKNFGKNKEYYSDQDSSLKINSMVAGAYYRHYMGPGYFLGAVYAGKLKADLSADNGVEGSIDGLTYGAKGELGYDIKMNSRATLTPYGSVTYNYIKFDKDTASNGKEMSIQKISDFELEAGFKFEQMLNNEHQLPTSVYVKPSIIQTITKGGKVKVDNKEYKDSLKNETIGRVEVGGDAYIFKNFAIGAFGNYSFGSKYDAWSVGGHLRYIW